MNSELEKIEFASLIRLSGRPESALTMQDIESVVNQIAALNSVKLDSENFKGIVGRLMEKVTTTMDPGFVVTTDRYRPWLNERRNEIKWRFWKRYEQLMSGKFSSKKGGVVAAIDYDTDKILDHAENPLKPGKWSHKGLVVGHVQSGKTANYTGLICKAADAGYKLIIVLAGMSNALRKQTQSRIDEGFVGLDTGKIGSTQLLSQIKIGVGEIDYSFQGVSLTSTLSDFKSNFAKQQRSLAETDLPFVAVLKKNVFSFNAIIQWLKSNNLSFDEFPLLLIDDESDHASINTNKPEYDPTTINRRINELLELFPKNCYIGYTATPFANVFINHDQEDIFPSDFIYSLNTPNNYTGPDQVFGEIKSSSVKKIPLGHYDESKDIQSEYIPLKHKSDRQIESIPPSLEDAIMIFVLTCAVRNLRGNKLSHKSMMVNVSVSIAVQTQVKLLINQYLKDLLESISVNYGLGHDALKDDDILKLNSLYIQEFNNEAWNDVLLELNNAASKIEVLEINSKSGDSLSYEKDDYPNGRSIIAIGGYSLSRGLTLEGLSVSYLLRNTRMYDTLMQMGRWFGYRIGYEDLCRIYMTGNSISWYEFISSATEELRANFITMDQNQLTPEEFGLCVKTHPASLLITAKNKMRSGEKIIKTIVSLSGRQIETTVFSKSKIDIENNYKSAETLIKKANKNNKLPKASMGYLSNNISNEDVSVFISSYNNHPLSIFTEPGPVIDFIEKSAKQGLINWDFLIVKSKKTESDLSINIDGLNISAGFRTFDSQDASYITKTKKKFSSTPWEAAGLDKESLDKLKVAYKGKSIPGHAYREIRKKPLLVLYFLDFKEDEESIANNGFLAWSISFPGFYEKNKRIEVTYETANTVWQQMDFDFNDLEDEEDYE